MEDRYDKPISNPKVFARFETVGTVLCTVVVMSPQLHMNSIPWGTVIAWAVGIRLGVSAQGFGTDWST